MEFFRCSSSNQILLLQLGSFLVINHINPMDILSYGMRYDAICLLFCKTELASQQDETTGQNRDPWSAKNKRWFSLRLQFEENMMSEFETSEPNSNIT